MICSLSVSSVHGILQARILEWVAISFCRGSSRPRDQTQGSPSLQADCLQFETSGKSTEWYVKQSSWFVFFFSSQSFTFPIDPQWMATPSVQFLKAKTQDLAIDPDWIHHLPHTKPLSSPTNSTSPGIFEKHHILSTSVTPPLSRSPAFLPALPALYFYSSLTSKLLESGFKRELKSCCFFL